MSRCITDERLDILVITETWHERSDSVELKRVVPPGYMRTDAARPIPSDARCDTADFQNHGGLAFVYSQAVEFQQKQLDLTVTTFEYLCGFATVEDKHFLLLGVYRPGSQALSAAFFDELSTVLELLAVYSCPVVVFSTSTSTDPRAIRLADLLLSFDCIQHVNESTHTAGYILDLVLNTATTGIQDLRVGDMLSDHALVCFTLQLNKPAQAAEYVTRRAW